jgi:hypothetical protein
MPIESIDGTRITVTVPASPPVTGDGNVDIIVGQQANAFATGEAVSCVGAESCMYRTVKGYQPAASMR